jgi:hypothetical protein
MQIGGLLRFLTSVLIGMVFCEVVVVVWERHDGTPSAPSPQIVHGALPPSSNRTIATHGSLAANGSPRSENWKLPPFQLTDDDPSFSTLMKSSNQTMSCFPRSKSVDETSVEHQAAWDHHPCGLLVDGYSMHARMPRAAYRHLVATLVQDMLYSSSKHLPYFHEFPRVVVIHSDAISDRKMLQDGFILHAESGAVVRLMESPVRGQWFQPFVMWGIFSRILLVVTNTTATAATLLPLQPSPTPFDVMFWTPFQRTFFVNASFAIPGRRKVAPPTLQFHLLDHFDVLLAQTPYMEEALLKLQRAECWPLSRDFEQPPEQGGFPEKQFYVGMMYHPGFTWYRRSARVAQLWRTASLFASDSSPKLRGCPTLQQLCEQSVLSDPLMHGAFALSSAVRAVRSMQPLTSPSISVVDPIHCADARYGADPCSRIVNRRGTHQKKDKFQMFRCDSFRG